MQIKEHFHGAWFIANVTSYWSTVTFDFVFSVDKALVVEPMKIHGMDVYTTNARRNTLHIKESVNRTDFSCAMDAFDYLVRKIVRIAYLQSISPV